MRAAVASARSTATVLRALGLRPCGGNYESIRAAIARMALDTTHFTRAGWRRGSSNPVVPRRALHELPVLGRLTNSRRLKNRLVESGVLLHACSECGITQWRGSALVLELHHVNGDRTDNRVENLRILCPNCHSQTSTYRGRNIGRMPLRVRERPRWRNRYTRDT